MGKNYNNPYDIIYGEYSVYGIINTADDNDIIDAPGEGKQLYINDAHETTNTK